MCPNSGESGYQKCFTALVRNSESLDDFRYEQVVRNSESLDDFRYEQVGHLLFERSLANTLGCGLSAATSDSPDRGPITVHD